MSLIKAMCACKKCNELKNIEDFAYIRDGGNRRKVCRQCNYGNRIHFYEVATEREILLNLKRRLMEKIEKTKGCWRWKAFIRPDGYTRIKFNGKDIGGHVASWMVHNKQIEIPTLSVLHICDNRSCTNPNHLFLGTHRDNSIDMVLKKRHPGIKLTVNEVRIIKERLSYGVPLSRLAKDFNVHWATINDIKHGKTWKHVK